MLVLYRQVKACLEQARPAKLVRGRGRSEVNGTSADLDIGLKWNVFGVNQVAASELMRISRDVGLALRVVDGVVDRDRLCWSRLPGLVCLQEEQRC